MNKRRITNIAEMSTMIEYRSVTTYRGLLEALQQASEEQLDLPIQCVKSHPVDEHVYALQQVICIGTVDALGLRYARSVTDNRRNRDELVLFSDGNPHGEDGAVAYEVDETFEGKEPFKHHKPIYPPDHDPSMDWTGPAQELADSQQRKRPHGTLRDVLRNRMRRDPF